MLLLCNDERETNPGDGGRLGRVRRAAAVSPMTWRALAQPGRGCVLWAMDYFLGKIDLGHCVNMNGAPHIRTPSRRSGARSCLMRAQG